MRKRYQKAYDEWVSTTNRRCCDELNLNTQQIPHLYFMIYNPKKKTFSLGLKTDSIRQQKQTQKWCNNNMTTEIYPQLESCTQWWVNKRYILVTFNVSLKMFPPKQKDFKKIDLSSEEN